MSRIDRTDPFLQSIRTQHSTLAAAQALQGETIARAFGALIRTIATTVRRLRAALDHADRGHPTTA